MLGKNRFHDKYLLLDKIGRGAFAQVYLAKDVKGSAVAVKVADLTAGNKPGTGDDQVNARSRRTVDREVSILRRVAAVPHCVRFQEMFVEGTVSYIVMEVCEMSFLQALERLPEVSERSLAPFFRGMLQALVLIHDLKVVHRDIKPDNFLCTGPKFEVKLCDFGLAEVVPDGGVLSGIYGTPPFLAPEMVGRQGYGTGVDVWSFGVCMYVLFLGHFPYKSPEGTSKGMQASILSGLPEPTFGPDPRISTSLGEGAPRVSGDALGLMRRLLCRDPAARPSAEEVLSDAWFTSDKGSENLQPVLESARRAGAFALRHNHVEETWNVVDSKLRELQAKHHGTSAWPQCTDSISPATRSSKRHSTDSSRMSHNGSMLVARADTESTTATSRSSASRSSAISRASTVTAGGCLP